MPDKPAAEIVVDEPLVRGLLTQAGTDAASARLVKVSEGWDSEIWRLGDGQAVRLPRRALAAPLVLHEQRALPIVGPAIEATGLRVPTPTFCGAPGAGYPWSWSIVPWIDGSSGLTVPTAARASWAASLAAALQALHAPAPAGFPVNPVRGRPFATRAEAVAERVQHLRATRPSAELERAVEIWTESLAAPAWPRDSVCVHGDLHPGNLLAHGGALVALIDFGDVTSGDPAYDLAIAWLTFDQAGRDRFMAALVGVYDADTWTRAHGWAAATAFTLLVNSDDNPDYAVLGAEALQEVAAATPTRPPR